MSKGITLAQLLARPDNELRTYDAAKVAKNAGFILEAQIDPNGPFYRVQDIKHEKGSLRVKVTGNWRRAAYVTFYRSVSDYNTAVRERSAHV